MCKGFDSLCFNVGRSMTLLFKQVDKMGQRRGQGKPYPKSFTLKESQYMLCKRKLKMHQQYKIELKESWSTFLGKYNTSCNCYL